MDCKKVHVQSDPHSCSNSPNGKSIEITLWLNTIQTSRVQA